MQEEDDARLYLDSISADFYFNDVVSMLLKAQPEDPIEFMCEYFQSIHDMEHVVNKRFEYVNATAYNRRSFLHTCLRSFGHFGDAQEVVIGDLFQLVTLLCSDYPETRMFEIPRLLRYDPSALLPFGELRIAFSVHFVYYDFLLDLKHIFCQASPPSNEQEDHISQTKDQSRQRLGWHAVDLTSVLARAEEYAVRTKEGELGCVPEKYVRQAYQDSETLTFDEFVFRLLTNHDLAAELREPWSMDWNDGDDTEEVAALFEKRNSLGEAGINDQSSEKDSKAPKSRSKEGKTKEKKKRNS